MIPDVINAEYSLVLVGAPALFRVLVNELRQTIFERLRALFQELHKEQIRIRELRSLDDDVIREEILDVIVCENRWQHEHQVAEAILLNHCFDLVLDDIKAGGVEAGVAEKDTVITKVCLQELLRIDNPEVLLHVPIRDVIILPEEGLDSEVLIPDVDARDVHALGDVARDGPHR